MFHKLRSKWPVSDIKTNYITFTCDLIQLNLALWKKVIYGHLWFSTWFPFSRGQKHPLLFSPHVPHQCSLLVLRTFPEAAVSASCEGMLPWNRSAVWPKTSCVRRALDFLTLRWQKYHYAGLQKGRVRCQMCNVDQFVNWPLAVFMASEIRRRQAWSAWWTTLVAHFRRSASCTVWDDKAAKFSTSAATYLD